MRLPRLPVVTVLPSRRGVLWGWGAGTLYSATVKLEPRDWWIGLYRDPPRQRVFVCLVPCFPILIGRTR